MVCRLGLQGSGRKAKNLGGFASESASAAWLAGSHRISRAASLLLWQGG
jgi:hypothetical protein